MGNSHCFKGSLFGGGGEGGDAAGDEFLDLGEFARGEQFGAFGGIGGDGGLGGIPEHEREIVVVCVLGVGGEAVEDGPAFGDGDALRGGSEVESHDR